MQSATAHRSVFLSPQFSMGQLAMTQGVYATFEQEGITPLPYLMRHQLGDWGEICPSDWSLNNRSINKDPEERGRLMSVYTTPGGTTIWVITEWDRSVTTILLPSEY